MNVPHHPRRRTLLQLSGAAALGAAMPLAFARDDYPPKTVRFVVPFVGGSGTDTTARLFAKKIGEATGASFIVENKPGGNGIIGVQQVLRAPPDGATVFIGSNSTLSTNAATFKSLPYDPLVDFAPITLLSRGPVFVIVPAASPYKTMADLVADARKRPGALNCGSGSVSYTLYAEWINEIAKIKTTMVNYKGAGEAVTATASSVVDYAVVDSGGALELVRSGRIRALAIGDEKRSRQAPEVPTAIEAGLPGYVAFNWVAAAVHAKTPQPIVDKLVALFKAAGQDRETVDFYTKGTSDLAMSTPAQMRQYQVDEIERWKRLVEVAKLELQ